MIYEFKCLQCNSRAEVSAPIAQGPGNPPLCTDHVELMPMQRQYRPIGVTYRGLGFYRTDFESEHDQFDRFYLQDKQSDQLLSVVKQTKSSAST